MSAWTISSAFVIRITSKTLECASHSSFLWPQPQFVQVWRPYRLKRMPNMIHFWRQLQQLAPSKKIMVPSPIRGLCASVLWALTKVKVCQTEWTLAKTPTWTLCILSSGVCMTNCLVRCTTTYSAPWTQHLLPRTQAMVGIFDTYDTAKNIKAFYSGKGKNCFVIGNIKSYVNNFNTFRLRNFFSSGSAIIISLGHCEQRLCCHVLMKPIPATILTQALCWTEII